MTWYFPIFWDKTFHTYNLKEQRYILDHYWVQKRNIIAEDHGREAEKGKGGEGDTSFQVVPLVTLSNQVPPTNSKLAVAPPIMQSPPTNPAFKNTRILGAHLGPNHNNT